MNSLTNSLLNIPVGALPGFSQLQLETLLILGIIFGVSFLYCFVVGEITRNNSQMDKLWSLLPEIYCWVICVKGGFTPRLLIMAILATLWGIRLTYNFGRKGAYKLKFWEGEEDYRWILLRQNKLFKPRWKWALFNFFFISFFQNFVVFCTILPALIVMDSPEAVNWIDGIAIGGAALFLLLETLADEQQWAFQTTKHNLLKEGKKLEELPAPFNKGFNTNGLWNYGRHPNYLGEQGFWVFFYVFSIGAGIAIFNWSLIGAVLLILLFLGSSTLGEKISASKYPEYKKYTKSVARYLFFKRYIKK